MKALIVRSFPDAQTELTDCPKPALEKGWVRIKSRYSALNYKDMLAITGQGKILRRYPLTPGIDCAGTVEASESSAFAAGDEVMVIGAGLGERFDGGLAEFAIAPADAVQRLPAGWHAKSAMLFGTAGFSAALAVWRLERAGITPELGEIAVTGAAGAVGLWAVRMLSFLGYDVCAITQAPEKRAELLYRMGAQRVLDYQAFTESDKPLQSAVFAAGIDQIGGKGLAAMLAQVKEHGAVCAVGMADSGAFAGSTMPFILRGIALFGITSTNCTPARRDQVLTWAAHFFEPDFIEQMPYGEVMLDEAVRQCQNWDSRPAGRIIVKIGDSHA